MLITTVAAHHRQTTVSLTVLKFSDLSLTSVKFPHFSRFSRCVVTVFSAMNSNTNQLVTLTSYNSKSILANDDDDDVDDDDDTCVTIS